jgi:hypothetical protein
MISEVEPTAVRPDEGRQLAQGRDLLNLPVLFGARRTGRRLSELAARRQGR